MDGCWLGVIGDKEASRIGVVDKGDKPPVDVTTGELQFQACLACPGKTELSRAGWWALRGAANPIQARLRACVKFDDGAVTADQTTCTNTSCDNIFFNWYSKNHISIGRL